MCLVMQHGAQIGDELKVCAGMDNRAQWQAYNAQWAAYAWQSQAGMYGAYAAPQAPPMMPALPQQLPGDQASAFAPSTPHPQVPCLCLSPEIKLNILLYCAPQTM